MLAKKRLLLAAGLAGATFFAASSAQAFWGPFNPWNWGNNGWGPGWGGPYGYGGHPGYWGGYPGYYGGYPYGYGGYGYGYPGYGYGYPGYAPVSAWPAPAAPAASSDSSK